MTYLKLALFLRLLFTQITPYFANVPSERSNEDIVSNKYGQLLLNFCINTGFKIANGRMFNANGIGR